MVTGLTCPGKVFIILSFIQNVNTRLGPGWTFEGVDKTNTTHKARRENKMKCARGRLTKFLHLILVVCHFSYLHLKLDKL